MTIEALKEFVCNARYIFAGGIIGKCAQKSFKFDNDADMRELRKVDAAASLLEHIGDTRYHELKVKINGLIGFATELRVAEEG